MDEKVYFAHPMNTYDTELEGELLLELDVAFPGVEIENPNQKKHQQGYKEWSESSGNGMRYFFEVVLPECTACVFLTFRDGKWPAGVAKEVDWFLQRELPVFRIDLDGKLTRAEAMPHYKSILTPDETRARIRDAEGNTVPY